MPPTGPEPGNEPPVRPTSGRRPVDVKGLLGRITEKAPEQPKLLSNSLGMKLTLVPAGTFQMGSPDDEPQHRLNEGPLHEVQLTQAFYLAVHPVTQEQFERVMGRNPSRFHAGNGGGPQHPVENVTWEEAVRFCEALSVLREEQAAGRVYRLPTEAEWEYACRAGGRTPFAHGEMLSASEANIDGQPPSGAGKGKRVGKTTPVGAYPANNFGLFDTHGNVWEWCADWYAEGYYRHSPPRDPAGPASGTFRVLRGGSWRNQPARCRAAYRNALAPYQKDAYTGFRVAMTVASR